MAPRICFSDLDGTIIQYLDETRRCGEYIVDSDPHRATLVLPNGGKKHPLTVFPPSSTGAVGVISDEAVSMLSALRLSTGVKLVIVTGARTTTLNNRLPFLPFADAYVAENGGRIFYPAGASKADREAPELIEDDKWREIHAPASGPASEDTLEPQARSGPIWSLYRELIAEGWSIDANNYFTGFRVRLGGPQPPGAEAVEALKAKVTQPGSLFSCTFNLGFLDVYPSTSGKAQAARYLIDRWGSAAASCAHMGDDDNDLELAALVGRVFVPKATSSSMREAILADRGHFEVINEEGLPGASRGLDIHGPLATDKMVRRMAAYFGGEAAAASKDAELATATA